MHQNRSLRWVPAMLLMLGGCAGEKPVSTPVVNTADAKALIDRALPRSITDRSGWSTEIYSAFTVLTVTPTRENICAVIAVIEQESGFQSILRYRVLAPSPGRKSTAARAAPMCRSCW